MRKHWVCAIRAVLGASAVLLFMPTAYADISGKVFRDFNANGTFDSGSGFEEVGVANVAVKAFDASGAEKGSTTSTADGSYTLTGLTAGADYRLVFSWAENWLKAGASGGTSVQFVKDGANGVNFGLNEPADYAQNKPPILFASQMGGLPSGTSSTDVAVYSLPYGTTGFNKEQADSNGLKGSAPIPSTDAQIGAMGTVWGLAWQANKHRAFTTAMAKRHSGLLDGAGYVYIVDYKNYSYADNHAGQTGTVAGKFNLQGVIPANSTTALDFGSICRTATCGNAVDYELLADKSLPTFDLDGFKQVGKVAIGDADMQPGSNTLWLVNLYQKGLVSVDVSADTVGQPSSAQVKQYLIETLPSAPTCQGGTLRPWALAFRSGKGYLGAVCDASTSHQASDLRAYVLAFDPANVEAGFTPVVSTALDYARDHLSFMPWLDTYDVPPIEESGQWSTVAPQPILSDIEFDENGNLYMNILDRFGHQVGSANYPAQSGREEQRGYIAEGDILKACKTTTGFAIEGSAECNTGKSMGEVFDDISGDGNGEAANGSFVQWKGSQELVSTMVDPHPRGNTNQCDSNNGEMCWWDTQGFNTFSVKDGQLTNWYTVRNSNAEGDAGKASGLGDMELLADPAPIEIGNRVWLDKDADGIQDAGEAGIPNVQVQLLSGTSVIATATTDADGLYYFSNAQGTSTGSKIYGITQLQANTAYTVRFPTTVAVAGSTYRLTTAKAGTDVLIDSDAAASGDVSVAATDIPVDGANNHSFDVGYAVQVDLELKKTANKTTAKSGDSLQYTLTVTNKGADAATGVNVKDQLPSSLNYQNVYNATQGSYANGVWAVGTLASGASASLTIDVTVK